ncbi:MAG TPA: hypothetical protein VNT53_01190 [Pseudolysinimonas sp.]|nr:hypothetical protein [Pseudolysinimonas sp.]
MRDAVVVDGTVPDAADVERLAAGADLDIQVAPDGSLAFFERIADVVQRLRVGDPRVRDLGPLANATALRGLTLEIRDRTPVVDLSGLPLLQTVTFASLGAWRAAGSAISAPHVHDVSVWHPEPVLFAEHPTRVESLRLVACRAMPGMPPLSSPQTLRSLWLQEAPAFDLTGITSARRLERLTIEHAQRVSGFGVLRELLRLRELTLGAVASVDEPAALADLQLHRFSEWTTSSAERIWWLADLEVLQARGVAAVDASWRPVREAYEAAWMARTGRQPPRHFPS